MRNRNQVVLPFNLEICIPKDDPVFKMVEICEQLDYTELYRAYLRSWRKINPETLFELLVFGYMNRKYSARQIEEACRTDIRYMWILQGEPVPDHSTIARFQNEKLSGVIEDLFYQLVEKLHEAGDSAYLLPSKANINSAWWEPAELDKEQDFDKFCKQYHYYNCNLFETGKQIAFYKKEN